MANVYMRSKFLTFLSKFLKFHSKFRTFHSTFQSFHSTFFKFLKNILNISFAIFKLLFLLTFSILGYLITQL